MAAQTPARIPVSTYRLQFNSRFTFEDARKVVPYLSTLGITECYGSSLLAARPGSLHGYDLCDHTRLNPDLGLPEEFDALADALRGHDMGLLFDFVPNHMAVDPSANLWWRNVLENGPSSPFARFFDIDWDPVKPELKGKVLLPILADQYGVALESGQLQLHLAQGRIQLHYSDFDLPLEPRELSKLLRHRLELLETDLDTADPQLREFLSILFQLEHLPPYTETDALLVAGRQREKDVAQERLAKLQESAPRIRQHVEQNLRTFNGEPGKPESFDLLHDLLEAQAYRLSYWRAALHEINYRRFFDINELAGLRMEDPEVFAASHSLVVALIRQGAVTGLRLDHVDGLYDPTEYFKRLAASGAETPPIYVVAEKILSAGECLREDWAVHGTTGYEFLNDLNGLFVDARSGQKFKTLYSRLTGIQSLFWDVVYESKKLIIMTSMASELNMLAQRLNRISEDHRRYRDFTLASLQEALREVVACFPVYRTYFTPEGWSDFDRKTIDTAVARALRRNPALEAFTFEFVRQMLLPTRAQLPDDEYQRGVQFAMKFQQYTGPVQAKGLEDTAFYRYTPLLSLNEVGGDPSRFGRSVDEFHRANLERLKSWPLSMLATSTHDTKQGEDARARLNVLSEIPDEWRIGLSRWMRVNAGMRTLVHGTPAPDRRDEYHFYQALLAVWPADATEPDVELVERIRQYMQKSIKEEKVHTSWINPSEEYEGAVAEFVKRVLAGPPSHRFLELFLPFQQRVARYGMVNSLSQLVLKIGSPGVADFYQGSELWDLNLVDPDNRRPVDYGRRLKLLEELSPLLDGSWPAEQIAAAMVEMLEHWQDGRIKLYLTATGLHLRRRMRELFFQGEYYPLRATGAQAEHLVAFARRRGINAVIVLAPRLVVGLTGGRGSLPLGHEVWAETTLSLPAEFTGRTYRNVMTRERVVSGHSLPIAELLRVCPVAVLLSE